MKRPFNPPFRTNSRSLPLASVMSAAGHHVEVTRQPAGRQALFCWEDNPQTRLLTEQFERGLPLDVPAKAILQAREALYHEARRVSIEGI